MIGFDSNVQLFSVKVLTNYTPSGSSAQLPPKMTHNPDDALLSIWGGRISGGRGALERRDSRVETDGIKLF